MNGFVMFIGSGDTPAAPDDYKLENAVNLNVRHLLVSFIQTAELSYAGLFIIIQAHQLYFS